MKEYLGKGCHSKKELEFFVEECVKHIVDLNFRIEQLKNNHTGNFG